MVEKIRYDIDVNARDGVRELDRLGKAGREAGKDIEAGMDDAESASKAALRALSQMTDTMESELQGTVSAVKALGDAFGTGFDQGIGERMVADLRKMGLTFEEIETDAKEFSDVMKRVDDIKLSAVTSGIKDVDQALGTVRASSDQSRSVLANLAGNAAQDLGALGGVVGSLGVGIGQLAEYAVDGNIALGNLAKIAGPMAALALASTAVGTALQGVKVEQEFRADLVDKFTEAMRNAGSAIGAIREEILETGELEFIDEGGFVGLGQGAEDLIPTLNRLGLSVEDFMRLVELSTTDGGAALQAFYGELAAGQTGTNPITGFNADVDALADAVDQYGNSLVNAEQSQATFNQVMGLSDQAVTDAFKAFRLAQDPIAAFPEEFRKITDALRGGYTPAASDMETVTEGLGITMQEAITIASDFERQNKSSADAMEGFSDSAVDARAALEETAAAAQDARRIMSGREWGQTALDGATSAFSDYFDQVNQFNQNVADQEAAWDGLGEVIEETGGHLIDFTGPEGRATWDALQELGATIVPDLARAWADADGDQDAFRRSANQIAQTTLVRLQDELGLSEEAAQQYLDVLGLTPEDVETQIKLAGDAEAVLQLQLLQGYIDTLDEGAQAEIAMHILADDPQAAVAVVQRELDATSTSVDLGLDTSPAMRAYQAFQLWLALHALEVAINARRGSGWGGYGGGGGGGAYPTMAPTATTTAAVGVMAAPAPITINVPIHAAVVGDRYDVQRVVSRAVRGVVRLAGARQ